MFFCICYDIANNRRRRKIEKALKRFGTRVQESVFEAALDEKRFQELKVAIETYADLEEDNLRFYRICKSCRCAIETMGVGKHPVEEEDILIV